jgi:hypothetical protein
LNNIPLGIHSREYAFWAIATDYHAAPRANVNEITLDGNNRPERKVRHGWPSILISGVRRLVGESHLPMQIA